MSTLIGAKVKFVMVAVLFFQLLSVLGILFVLFPYVLDIRRLPGEDVAVGVGYYLLAVFGFVIFSVVIFLINLALHVIFSRRAKSRGQSIDPDVLRLFHFSLYLVLVLLVGVAVLSLLILFDL